MSKVMATITMSLDGYVAGPRDRVDVGLGEGGERLHWWMFGEPDSAVGPDPADTALVEQTFRSAGAAIVGRTMHDIAEGWGDDPGFGMPVFVLTHRPEEAVVKGDTRFEFVTEGIDATLARARAAAGERHVIVLGGADTLRQFLASCHVDELTLTIAPFVLGGGKRLFEGFDRADLAFERFAVVESPLATHVRYHVS